MKISNGFKILIFLVILFSFIGFCFVLAAEENSKRPLEISYPKSPFSGIEITSATPIPVFIKYIFEYSISFVLCFSILLLVFAGFKYIISLGNPAEIKNARERIESAILGIAIVLFAFLILNTVDPDLLKSNFKIPKINLSVTAPKIEEIKSITNFQQIPISYLILNRLLGIENYIAEKEKKDTAKNIKELEIKLKKLANDRFGQNRLDNIYNKNALDITGKKKLYEVGYEKGCQEKKIETKECKEKEYQGVSAYTKIIAQKIEEKTNSLKEKLENCHCGGSDKNCTNNPWRFQVEPVNSSAGWWIDNGACENFPCGNNDCKCGSSFPCKSYCQCYGEPCPNRTELRQLQTDLEVLANAFEVYIDGNQWVSDWIKKEKECFEKGICKKFEETKNCHFKDKKQCYTWAEEKYGITSETKVFIYQIAKNEQVYGGLGEVVDNLKKQRDQLLEARGGIYYGSKFYLETTPFGFFWSEPFYKFTNAGLDEYDKLFQIEHESWKESENDLMNIKDEKNPKIKEENKKLCEEVLKGSWNVIADGINPEELSIRAVCGYNQEFSSGKYGADPVNNQVIFYKSASPGQSILESKRFLSDLIPTAMAFDLGCSKGQSIGIPVGDAISNSLGLIEKLLNNLDNGKTAKIDRREVGKYIWAKKELPEIQRQMEPLEAYLNHRYETAANMAARAAEAMARDRSRCRCMIDYYEHVWRFNEATEKSKEKRDLDKLKAKEILLKGQIQEFENTTVKTYDFNDLDLKEIANYVIFDARTIVDAVDEVKGSNCSVRFSRDEVGRKCCPRTCQACRCCKNCGGPGCSPCREYERSEEVGFLNKFFSFLKISSVSADSCENCDMSCSAECECGCYQYPCPFCKSCRTGHCESCFGKPFPQMLLPTMDLISLYSNPDFLYSSPDFDGIELKIKAEFAKLNVDYYIKELNNVINQPQEWESDSATYSATYVEKINSDLKKSAENFASAKFCNSFPVIGSKDYEEWKNGVYLVPLLIDKNMAATTYGINAEQWKKLVGDENNFYCCLPYEVN